MLLAVALVLSGPSVALARLRLIGVRTELVHNPTTNGVSPGNVTGAPSDGFTFPEGVAVDRRGNVYVADSSRPGRIQKLSGHGSFLGLFVSGETSGIQAIALAPDGSLYAVASRQILHFDRFGTPISRWGLSQGDVYDGATGIAVDHHGRVYVAFSSVSTAAGQRLRVFNGAGQLVAQWGGEKQVTTGTPGELGTPAGVAVDQSRNVYVADTQYHRVQKFDRRGHLRAIIGAARGPGHLDQPQDLALDRHGNLFVTGGSQHRFVEYDAHGRYRGRWSTDARPADGFVYLGARPADRGPTGIAITRRGVIYIADAFRHRLLVYRE